MSEKSLYLSLVIVMFFALVFVVGQTRSDLVGILFSAFFLIFILTITSTIIYENYFRARFLATTAQRLAKRLGWTYQSGQSLDQRPLSVLLSLGSEQKTINLVRGKLANTDTVVYDFETMIPARRGPDPVRMRVLDLEWPETNNWVLLNKKHIFDLYSYSFLVNAGRVSVSMGNNLDKYFNSYALPDRKEPLKIFTPDFVKWLIENGKEYSFEWIDGHLLVFTKPYFLSFTIGKETKNLLEFGQKLLLSHS